jgi:phosphoglycolate phosphatase-like HAD superfamily hydrolase
MLEKISEIITFDQQKVLNDINSEISELENNPIINENVVDFIRAHYKEYLFFTNTSLPRGSLDRILKALNLGHCFQKLFAGEDGFKKDNIYSIIEQY